jgi:thymidylate synthase
MVIKADEYYIKNLTKIIMDGTWDENPRPKYKDGEPAKTKYITQVFEEYDISKKEFPIPTLRNTAIKTGIKEILWIYQKQNASLTTAHEMGINWWDEWDIGNNTIGQRYGATVNKWDLMNDLLNGLEKDPFGRRHIINLYQKADLTETPGLYPCAYETLFSIRKVNNKMYLDMTLIQRSSDYITAGYINKIQYVAFQMMIAGHLKYEVGKFCHLTQNLHIYDRHFDAVSEILEINPKPLQPELKLNQTKNFWEYTIDDFTILNTENIEKINSPIEIAI